MLTLVIYQSRLPLLAGEVWAAFQWRKLVALPSKLTSHAPTADCGEGLPGVPCHSLPASVGRFPVWHQLPASRLQSAGVEQSGEVDDNSLKAVLQGKLVHQYRWCTGWAHFLVCT